jgi:hypothetical protein
MLATKPAGCSLLDKLIAGLTECLPDSLLASQILICRVLA